MGADQIKLVELSCVSVISRSGLLGILFEFDSVCCRYGQHSPPVGRLNFVFEFRHDGRPHIRWNWTIFLDSAPKEDKIRKGGWQTIPPSPKRFGAFRGRLGGTLW
jgi:hypothetical protein